MIIDAKKEAQEYWKAGDPVKAIQTKLALTRPERIIKRWVNRWNQIPQWAKPLHPSEPV